MPVKLASLFSLALLLCLPACQAQSAAYSQARDEAKSARLAVDETHRQLADGIDTAVQAMHPDTQANDPAWSVAANLSRYQRQLFGAPRHALPVLSAIAGDAAAARELEKWKGEATAAAAQLTAALDREAELNAKVVAQARELEEIQRRSFWGKIKAAAVTIIVGLLLLFALYITVVTGAFPGIASRLGITSVKVVHSLVRAVGLIRKTAKANGSVDLRTIDDNLELQTGPYRTAVIDRARRHEDV